MNRLRESIKRSMRKIVSYCLWKILLPLRDALREKPRYHIDDEKWHHGSSIDGMTPQFVKIGRYFVSGPDSFILSHDASYFIFTEKYLVEPTEIGDDVFLGVGAIILPGVKIGNRVVVGAGSVVTDDVPDNCVVVGNPAKVICTIDEYLQKAETRGVLYSAPYSKEHIRKQLGSVTPKQLNDIQKSMIEQYRKRNPNQNEWIKYNNET